MTMNIAELMDEIHRLESEIDERKRRIEELTQQIADKVLKKDGGS